MKDNLNGLFELKLFENAQDDDILNLTITEGNDDILDTPIEENAAPANAEKVGEKPAVKADEVSVKIPAGSTITADVYNDSLKQIKQSFKEGVELLDMLMGMKVVEESTEVLQERFMEDKIAQAILESYEDGPLFEAVEKEDKAEIKALTKKIRGDVEKFFKAQDRKFYDPKALSALIKAITLFTVGGALTLAAPFSPLLAMIGGITQLSSSIYLYKAASLTISTRIWQIVGVLEAEEANVAKLVDAANKEFDEELGKYKLLYYEAFAVQDKKSKKLNKNAYVIIIDEKLPMEFSDSNIKAKAEELEKADEGKGKKEKEEK